MPVDKVLSEKRITQLAQLTNRVTKVMTGLAGLSTAKKPEQLKMLDAALKTIESMRAIKVTGTRKAIDACQNEIVSLREAVFSNTKLKKVDYVLDACLAAIESFQKLTKLTNRRMELDEAGNSNVALDEEGNDIAVVTIMKHLKEANKLPKFGDKLYVLGRAPVVVVTTGRSDFKLRNQPSQFVDRSKLEKGGFKVDVLDGYAIIRDQMVIGVNRSAIPQDKNRKLQFSIEDVRDEVLDAVQRQTKKRWQVVVEHGYGHRGGAWFWIMPEQEMVQFAKAFPGGHPKLNEWGFAF